MGRKRGRRGQRKGQIYFLRAMDLDDGPLSGHCGLWLFGFPQGRRPIGLHAHLCKHQCACVHILLAHLCMCVHVTCTSGWRVGHHLLKGLQLYFTSH